MTDTNDLIELVGRAIQIALTEKDAILGTIYKHEIDAAAKAAIEACGVEAQAAEIKRLWEVVDFVARNERGAYGRMARKALSDSPEPSGYVEWKTLDQAPQDGSVIWGAESYRWKKYKPGAPKNLRKKGGRWQRFNGHGFENAEPPTHWTEPKPPASEGE